MSIVEMQLSAPAGKAEKATPDWTYRLGAWYNTHSFDDQRFDETGRSLSDPSSNGIPREHKGNFSFYIAADQVIWRDRSAPERSISVLARFMKTPFKDRNLIDASLNMGVVFRGPNRHRPNDTLALGAGYAHVTGLKQLVQT